MSHIRYVPSSLGADWPCILTYFPIHAQSAVFFTTNIYILFYYLCQKITINEREKNKNKHNRNIECYSKGGRGSATA